MYVCLYVYMYVCMHVYIYIYIYINNMYQQNKLLFEISEITLKVRYSF